MTARTKYDFERLDKYCKENGVTLVEDYSNTKINRDNRIRGNCIYKNCDNEFEKSYRELINAGGYCTYCIQIIRNQKRRLYNLQNYGNEEPQKIYDFKKLQEICKEKNIILIKNYENVNIFGETEIEGICINNCGGFFKRSLKEIIKNENLSCSPCKYSQGKLKRIKTCIKKYGVESISSLTETQQKIKCSNLIKYGVEYTTQLESNKEKFKQTCIKKYGYENPTQNPEIAEKASNNSYQTKDYILPSGSKIKFQGYENLALDELFNIYNINENDIFNKKSEVPEIWYTDENNKKRRHYVDIYIKSQNKCIEVKSEWYYKQSENIILLKQKAAKELGYKYEIWIYNSKKEKISCYH